MATSPGITVKLSESPEIISILRREMARLLVERAAEAADDGDRNLERSLVEIAAAFEAGQ